MANPPEAELHKGLKQRHLTMIAIGGVIGAGLFVGSGAVINEVGPVISCARRGAPPGECSIQSGYGWSSRQLRNDPTLPWRSPSGFNDSSLIP